ncbi:hypothetical protein SEA_CRICKO_26 [Streptomyces phage CricKo]|jgi:hypothetical protein|nr:hypothetical protein SEA_RAINYDAI_26 [Streptomyces phage Rainydai]AWN06128.1 hypothetical protein SEA_SENDITCS_25 [Streptomyces phage SendItCS]QJD49909.1 hypothetical protein SEA_CRICKO_26 [Streptomyces phage CricKo]QNL30641.1 hypothetical protein SEA_THIQQUMS_26 [Streptomyces phage Thiqqums]WIC89363.1 membrane protein [Streptomyces phage Miek]
MDEVWIRVLMTVLGSAMGSTGLWAFIRSRDTHRKATNRLLMGMAYETITKHGIAYIERGSVTKDEFEELNKYFYVPYKALGGNGVAERIMDEVKRLPFRSHNRHPEIFQGRDNEGWVNNVRVVTREEAESSPGR